MYIKKDIISTKDIKETKILSFCHYSNGTWSNHFIKMVNVDSKYTRGWHACFKDIMEILCYRHDIQMSVLISEISGNTDIECIHVYDNGNQYFLPWKALLDFLGCASGNNIHVKYARYVITAEQYAETVSALLRWVNDNDIFQVNDEGGRTMDAYGHIQEAHGTVPCCNDNEGLHKSLTEQLHETYVQKNTAYGSSFEDTYNEYGILSAATRIADKYNRFKTLAKDYDKGHIVCGDESIKDTLMDMANYCLLTVMAITKENK